MKRHLQRNHLKYFKIVDEKDRKNSAKSKRLESTLKNGLTQKKFTDFVAIPPIMTIAVNLAVRNGLSFSVFDSEDMKKLIDLAKTGAQDSSTRKVNPENVKKSLAETSQILKNQLKRDLRGKILSITADFATCERRSFLST